MAESDGFSTVVEIRQYVEKRATQMADLLQVVDNQKLVSGEVTKGPRTAAQRLPRHMRRRAMAYEIRRFPKGLRNFAAPFIISNHRKKPPSRYYRRRSRNLLLNYIRRQRKCVWLETHIWHAKRFHMVERWGYRIPDRSFQRNFRPIFRASMKHCTVRDKSYLCCLVITGQSQEELLQKMKPFCAPATGPTVAFKSALSGCFEMSTLLYEPGRYPSGLVGPVRYLWSSESGRSRLSLWVHPSCKDHLMALFTKHFSLSLNETVEESPESFVPVSVEEWRIKNAEIRTKVYTSADKAITVEDLKDQLGRFRFYGPKSMDIVRKTLRIVEVPEGNQFSSHHEEWSRLEGIGGPQFRDGRVFSLLVEDPRISFSTKRAVPEFPPSEAVDGDPLQPLDLLWCRDARISSLKHRLSDAHMNKLKEKTLDGVRETACKIPILVVIRNQGSGRSETLEGVELILPGGFGRDFWVSAQLNTAHASGIRDDAAAHLESRCFEFPTDYVDCTAGQAEMTMIRRDLEEIHQKKPHNRRVLHWKNMSIAHPYSFEFPELVKQWSGAKNNETYVLRDRRALREIDEWLGGKGKKPEDVLASHPDALVSLRLDCVARGKPKRYALVCLPTVDDLKSLRDCRRQGRPFILTQPKRGTIEEKDEPMEVEENSNGGQKGEVWKDVVSLDPASREKPIPLKPLFPDTKNQDRASKRKRLNREKKEKAKKRRVELLQRLELLNQEEAERERCGYRLAANRETVGRVVRGDFSFTAARGLALALVPLCTLEKIRSAGNTLLLRNISSKYYHPANLSLLIPNIEL